MSASGSPSASPAGDPRLAYYNSQKKYYSEKAKENKQRYDLFQLIISFGHIAVPFLLVADIPKWIPTLVSIVVAFCSLLERRFQFGDLWLNYRVTSENLRREKALFDARAGRYHRSQISEDDVYSSFIERCTEICTDETSQFYAAKKKAIQDAIEEDKKSGELGGRKA